MRPLLICILFAGVVQAQTNTCVSGSIANAYCQPQVINGHFLAVNRTGDVGNNEVECYRPENVFISDGNLVIQQRSDTMTCGNSAMQGEGFPPYTFNYTSGYVMMAPGYAYQYGDWKVRAKMPASIGSGSWPAIWLIGSGGQQTQVAFDNSTASCKWPQLGCEELDLAELQGGKTGADGNTFLASGYQGTCTYSFTDATVFWHTYELRWDTSGYTIWVDGAPTSCTADAAHSPATPMFLVMNDALGGFGGGTVTASGFPSTMQIDYVQVCSSTCNGANTVFYDDFQTPVAPSLLRPVARMARRAGANISAGAAMVISGRFNISGAVR